MPVPLNQAIKVGAYVVKQHLLGNKRYPLVLMLEPTLPKLLQPANAVDKKMQISAAVPGVRCPKGAL